MPSTFPKGFCTYFGRLLNPPRKGTKVGKVLESCKLYCRKFVGKLDFIYICIKQTSQEYEHKGISLDLYRRTVG